MAEKEPRWDDDPPPGFMADGTFLGVPKGQKIKRPPEMIDLGDGRLVTPEEFEKLQAEEDGEPDLEAMEGIADEVADGA